MLGNNNVNAMGLELFNIVIHNIQSSVIYIRFISKIINHFALSFLYLGAKFVLIPRMDNNDELCCNFYFHLSHYDHWLHQP